MTKQELANIAGELASQIEKHGKTDYERDLLLSLIVQLTIGSHARIVNVSSSISSFKD